MSTFGSQGLDPNPELDLPEPQNPPQAYAQPMSYQQAPRTNVLAIASLVMSFLFFVYGIGALLAVIFGHMALSQIQKDPSQAGKGLAITGVILGWLQLALIASVLTVAIAAEAS